MPIHAHLNRAQGALTRLDNGRHAWNSDVNALLGSQDLAPDPHDLLDSALAACTTLTLELYIRRHKMAVTDLHVEVSHQESKDATGQVHYQLQRQIGITGDIGDTERARLMEIANKCPIHNILTGQTTIQTSVVGQSA